MNRVSKNIMRRVYYAFWLRKLKHPVVSHGAILVASYVLLAQVVSVPDVWRNLMEVEVGMAANYLFSALVNSEVTTWILLGLMSVTMVSMLYKMMKDREITQESDNWAWR